MCGRSPRRTDLEPGAKLAQPEGEDGKTRSKVAKAVGMGRTSYAKAKAVVAATEGEGGPPASRDRPPARRRLQESSFRAGATWNGKGRGRGDHADGQAVCSLGRLAVHAAAAGRCRDHTVITNV